MTGNHGGQLPCGAAIDDVVAQVADGDAGNRTPHQQTCPHCQAALAEYDRLWSPVADLAAKRVQVPDSVIEQVLRRIHYTTENPAYGLLPGAQGLTRISVRVIIATARVAAEHIDGVRAALTHDRSSDYSAAITAGVTGSNTAIEIVVAATYGYDLPDLAERIRRAVARDIQAHTGLQPADITVVIDDVFQP